MDMERRSEPFWARPSATVTALTMATGRVRSLALAREGIGRLEEPRQRSLETSDVLRTFFDTHAPQAEEFLRRAGTDVDAFRQALSEGRSPEPQPEPPRLQDNSSEGGRKIYERRKRDDDERRAKGEAAPFSAPLKIALRNAREGLPEGAREFGLGAYVVALLTTESNARDAFLEVADPAWSDEALAWLWSQPDPEGEVSLLGDFKANHRELLDAVWPSVQAKMESERGERGRAIRDEQYEKNPAQYEEPLDVAKRLAEYHLEPDNDYSWRSGVLLHAAANEARIRKASEATLDHLLVALLRDGTDSAAFLDARGVNRKSWMRRLDEALPRFAEGPRWPPNARDLNMSIHTNGSYQIKPLPEGRAIESLTKEERKEYVEQIVDPHLRFTDPRYLANVPDEPKTIAHDLFEEAGITRDALIAEIVAREKGDRDWWRRRPDLVAQLRGLKPRYIVGEYERSALCVAAAQYEARMRNAPKTEYDDLLVALLVPGTDVWSLAFDLRTNPAVLHDKVDVLRPRFESGPIFPDTTDDLNPVAIMTKQGFSDLLFLHTRFSNRQDSPGLRLLQERGLSSEAVDARLAELGVVPF